MKLIPTFQTEPPNPNEHFTVTRSVNRLGILVVDLFFPYLYSLTRILYFPLSFIQYVEKKDSTICSKS